MSEQKPPPPKPGEVVTARVKQVAPFGLFMDYCGHDLLLLIPETSWVASYASCEQLADVDDEFRVRVLHYAEGRDRYAVSHKAVYPDSNPWGNSCELRVGDTLEATVVRPVKRADRCGDGAGWLLELRPGAYVVLCGHGDAAWAKGEQCRVTVTAVAPDQRVVEVRLAL
ncbi:MAG TPA: S1 RNA-binding domain-containing protein [Gemmata sp.]